MNGTVGKTAITQKIPNAIHPSTTLEVPANAILANPSLPLQLKLLTIALQQEPVTTHKLKRVQNNPPNTKDGQTGLTRRIPAGMNHLLGPNLTQDPAKLEDKETLDMNKGA